MKTHTTLINVLKEHTRNKPDALLYRYIEDDKSEPLKLTFSQVDEKARSIAATLLQTCKKGDRALMLYPAGLEFITAFYACLYAGIIAVPAYPPRKNQKLNRLKSMISDAKAAIVLTTQKTSIVGKPLFESDENLVDLPWLITDAKGLLPAQEIDIEVDEHDIAFLQYTSGSTGDPKGVMVTHANIMSNMEVIYDSFGHSDDTIGMSWLPHFHDMGLIGGVMQPLFGGFEVTLMAPAYFLQKPIRWLRGISEYGVNSSGGPNFAYDLCVDNINDEDLVGLDLSTWTVAPNGAEPIHANTLKNFSDKFATCGFEHKTHYPCYGMAETTLMVTGASFNQEPMELNVSKKKLQEGVIVDEKPSSKTQSLVSSGRAWLDHEVVLVDPKTLNTVEENKVAEVWISGKSVTGGYWKNPEKTQETFHAYTNDTKEGPYLRTGDLGFLHKGELFICGRAKDLLIIRGRNYYPQDIEEVASSSHEALMYNMCAAFSTTIDNQEQLILVQEVKRTHIRKIVPEEIFEAIRKSVVHDIEVQLHNIILVRPGQVLKTSSGKIQRHANKKAYEADEFTPLASFLTEEKLEMNGLMQTAMFSCDIYQELDIEKSRAYVEKSIKSSVACLLEIHVDRLKTDQDLLTLGLDSLTIAQFVSHLECSYSLDIEFETLFEISSLDELIVLIQSKMESGIETSNSKMVTITKDVKNENEAFNLNEIQQAYLLGRSSDMVLGNTSCFAYTEIESSQIDLVRLEKAWNKLLERHDMLRAVIKEDFTQNVLKEVPKYFLNETDISELNEDETLSYLEKRREEITTTVLDPSQWPMLFLEAFTLANGKKRILIYVDMLVCDASSTYILLNDLKTFYDTPDVVLPKLEIGFRDYLIYEEEYKKSEKFNKSLEYWKSRLETLPNGPELPLAIAPENIKKPEFSRRHYRLDAQKWSVVQDRAKNLRITPTVMLLSLFSRVLAFYSNNPHFCVNLTLFNRMPVHEQINNIVGDFTSLIPLEVNATAEKSLETLFKEVQKQLFKDIDYKEVSGVRVLRELRSIGEEHIMPVVFTSTLGLKGLDTSWLGKQVFTISQTPQVWLDNQVSEVNGDLVINWDCIDELFEESMLSNMFDAYIYLIESLVQSDEILTSTKVSLLPVEQLEKRQAYNQTELDLPTENIASVFMKKAFALGEKEAIKTSALSISYAQLHNASAQIASFLKDNNATNKEHVAIFLNKGSEQVFAVMACAYAGVPYLPIATDLPKNRIDFLLQEASVKIILSDEENLANLEVDVSYEAVNITGLYDLNKSMPRYEVTVDDKALAYTIFTSGSTGKPKGVMLSNESVCNTIMDINQRYNINENDRIFAISALNFDLSVFDIYGAFTSGACLVIPDEKDRKDSTAWFNWVKDENITVWNSVPAIVKLLCDEVIYKKTRLNESLRLVLMSGDFIAPQIIEELDEVTSQECELVSLGGATEGSIWSIYFPIEHSNHEKIPYGYPLANQKMHVLDSAFNPRPHFVHGDIYIEGKGVALGYLNDEERTNEQFVKKDNCETVFYKTGDVGFFNPKGYIEIDGRIDDQVKIHGYRVELGEIEMQLLKVKGVKESVVLAKEDTLKHKVLVAYVVSHDDICLVELRDELLEHLPEYMVPNAIMVLDEMPLTANAKIDKKALLVMEVVLEHSHEYAEARNETEKYLVDIFQKVLGQEKIGINDDFFELGGDSLKATQLVSRIRHELKVELPIKDFFINKTIEGLSHYIQTIEKKSDFKGITVAKNREKTPLSFAQERILFLDELENGEDTSYHNIRMLHLKGDLEVSVLKRVFETIVARHEVLRTNFLSENELSYQAVNDGSAFELKEYSMSKPEMDKSVDSFLNWAFKLDTDFLFRANLYNLAEDEHYLLINIHHIVADGWSIMVMIQEFVALYNAYLNGGKNPLPDLDIQYGDYSVWQRDYLQGEVLDKQLEYWVDELEGITTLNLPTSFPRPSVPSYKGNTFKFVIEDEVLAKLNVLNKKYDTSLFMTLLSSFSLLLHRYTSQDDITIGIPIANRNYTEVEGLIGFFINTLIMRQDYSASPSFKELLEQVKERTLSSYEHQDVPFEKIVDALNLPRDMSRSALFQVAFVLQSDEDINFEIPGLSIEDIELNTEKSKFDMTVEMQEIDGHLHGSLEYATDLFSQEYIENFVANFKTLLLAITKEQESQVGEYTLLTQEQESKQVLEYNQSQVDINETLCVHQDFERQVLETPENVALVYENEELRYKVLNEKANQLAHYLIEQGVKVEERVVISLDRSFEMIISVLAVLKAGAAYVPVDPSYPQERINYITSDANAKLVLNEKSLKEINTSSYATSNPGVDVKKENLAYIIYTSGSTGLPKGVMLEHSGVLDLNEWYSKSFNFNESSTNLLVISFGFDAVQKNIFTVLKTGGKIVLPRSEVYNPEYLASLIEEYKCTHLNCVPSAFYPLLETSKDYKNISSLEYVLVGGEATKKENISAWYKKVDTKLVNIYGPTECNDISLFHLLDKDDTSESIPVGKPTFNTQVYILDKNMKFLPLGGAGELYISGNGLARGYLNQDELTNETFINNPFTENTKMYKTGDLVKYLENGNIEYLGRVDEQVKIRGFRIELGEIEQQLLHVDNVKQSVVLAPEDENGNKNLVAYVVSEDGSDLVLSSVKAQLLKHLPEFMVPSAVVTLEAMPLTPNAKIDKKSLEELTVVMESSQEYIAPRNETEEVLAEIFAEVLKVNKVGVFDDFFELGGHSLLATQLVSKVRNRLNVELPLKELFSSASIDALSQYLEHSARETNMTPINVVQDRTNMPLSFSQERLWFIDQLDTSSADYNIPIAISMQGDLDISMLEKALKMVVARHETLRTIFPSEEGQASQVILEEMDFTLRLEDISEISENKQETKAQSLAQDEANTPFDLINGPLFRALVIKLSSTQHILMLNMHHIISDGWSMGILFNEFDFIMMALSKNEEVVLPELRVHYADYGIWQRERLAEGKLQKDLQYWEDALSPYPTKLNVSKLQAKDKEENSSVQRRTITVDPKLLTKLTALNKENNWTLNQVLLSLYGALIYRYTNNESMIIAVPNANRPTSETEEMIGFFVNTMLIKLDFEQSNSYQDIANQVQDKLLSAIEHQEAPLQSIIESVRAKEGMINIDDNFQFAFNSLPLSSVPENEGSPLSYEVFDIGSENVKTLLTMTLAVSDEKTEIQLSYKDSELDNVKVEQFLENYHTLIEELCSDTEQLVSLSPVLNSDVILNSDYEEDEVKAVYPLTRMQSDMYVQGVIHFDNKYIIGWSYEVKEDLDLPVFKNAIKHVFTNIDSTNVALTQDNGKYYQMLLESSNDGLIVDVQMKEDDNVEALMRKVAHEHINLEKGISSMAVLVYEKEVLKYVAYMGHHAIVDALSLTSIKTLVDKSYKNYLSESDFGEVKANNTIADISTLSQTYNTAQAQHWKATLENVGNISVFNPTNLGKQVIEDIVLDQQMFKDLTALRKLHKVSFFALVNAIYLSVLYRLYNFSDDIVLYEPLSTRKSLKNNSIGMYLDIRPLVVKNAWFKEDENIISLAKNIQAFQKENTVSLSVKAQAELIQGGDAIFGINYIPRLKEKDLTPLDCIPENEVQFTVFSGSEYILRFTYPENVFGGIDIREKYLLSVKDILVDDTVTVSSMQFLSEDEEERLLNQFDNEKVQYKNTQTIHKLFEDQVVLQSGKTALVYEGESLSYAQLNDKANVLAHYLISEGVKADDLVGICVERSFEMIIGLLAILKAGGAYLPIDPSSPKDRIEYILEDSKAKLVLTQASLEKVLASTKAKVILIDELKADASQTSNPNVEVQTSNMAYVIYTSGSTGKPKGVMLEHANVDRLFQASQEKFGFDENDSWTLFHSFAFDFSVWEIWGALLHGGKLHVLTHDMTRSSEDFYNYLVDEKVTILNQTPAAFNQLIHIDASSDKRLDSLRKVIFGGEKLEFNIFSLWFEKYEDTSPELINMYGITETTVHVTYHTITKEDVTKGQSLIGKPYDDLSCYILDENSNLVPQGLQGELHVAGAGLARGYLFQEELTNERFIKSPFAPDEKLYKTGDLVRFLDDGSMEYLGRTDEQVKIRGFRIELGEIEHQILSLESIKEAVVLVKEDANSNAFLMAYVRAEEQVEFSELKAKLSEYLPEYMLPTAMMQLETMPLTSNGKIDKKALVKLDVNLESSAQYVAPRDKTEETLCRLFAQILNLEKVGIYDNFFEIGGNSLLSVQLVSLIKAEGLAVEVKHIFQAQCVAKLSVVMQDNSAEEPLDLDKEAVLEEEIQVLNNRGDFSSTDAFLTGATGFVGRYLLTELLQTSDVNVYCAVRAKSDEEAMQRIKNSLEEYGLWKDAYATRVIPVIADLAKPKLGIDDKTYDELSVKIDKLYHCATYMNSFATYEFMKEVNVGGLKELLRFASNKRDKNLEYVSTIEILNSKTLALDENISLYEHEHFKSKGYSSTKYVAEKICELAKERGFEINIYRLGLITGDTKLGKNDSSQWFQQLIESGMKLSSLFNVDSFAIPITPVDFVTKSIVSLAKAKTENRIYHITNNNTLRLADMLDMYNDDKQSLEHVTLHEFIQRLKAYNAEHDELAVTPFFEKYLDAGAEVLEAMQAEMVEAKQVQNAQTLETLKSLDVEFPPVDDTLIKKYFNASIK